MGDPIIVSINKVQTYGPFSTVADANDWIEAVKRDYPEKYQETEFLAHYLYHPESIF